MPQQYAANVSSSTSLQEYRFREAIRVPPLDLSEMQRGIAHAKRGTEPLKAQKESTAKDIEACELMMVECREDSQACTSLSALQAKYEAVADELDDQIQKLR